MVLFRAHQNSSEVKPRPPVYGAHTAFNEYVDAAHSVQIFGIEYRPSEVLFQVDPRAYVDYLAEFSTESRAKVPET